MIRDRVTLAAVVVVALVAALVSFGHMQTLASNAGESWRSWLIPISVDGLIVAASMVLLTSRRQYFAWVALVTGVIASLAANMAAARPEAVAVLVAGWAPIAFAASFHILLNQRQRQAVQLSNEDTAAIELATAVPVVVTSTARQGHVYRLFDVAGELLYVGTTVNVAVRMRNHKHDQFWWPEVAEIHVDTYMDRDEALRAERAAIKEESPKYNIRHREQELLREVSQRRLTSTTTASSASAVQAEPATALATPPASTSPQQPASLSAPLSRPPLRGAPAGLAPSQPVTDHPAPESPVPPAVRAGEPAPLRQPRPRPEVKESGSGPRRSATVEDARKLVREGLGRAAIAERLAIGTGTARRLIDQVHAEDRLRLVRTP